MQRLVSDCKPPLVGGDRHWFLFIRFLLELTSSGGTFLEFAVIRRRREALLIGTSRKKSWQILSAIAGGVYLFEEPMAG